MFTPTDLVVVVPMLGRAHRVIPLLDSLSESVPGARVLFVLSPGDGEVRRAVDAVGMGRVTVPGPHPGDYARKINTGIALTSESLVFTGADDLKFHPGWFEAATAMLKPGVGVVGTNDLANPRVIRGEHATHMLVTREYVETFGTIDGAGFMHEGYPHEFCDDEAVATAKRRGAWVFAPGSVVEHLHPHWNPDVPMDALYAAQPARMAAGRKLFQRRARLWR